MSGGGGAAVSSEGVSRRRRQIFLFFFVSSLFFVSFWFWFQPVRTNHRSRSIGTNGCGQKRNIRLGGILVGFGFGLCGLSRSCACRVSDFSLLEAAVRVSILVYNHSRLGFRLLAASRVGTFPILLLSSRWVGRFCSSAVVDRFPMFLYSCGRSVSDFSSRVVNLFFDCALVSGVEDQYPMLIDCAFAPSGTLVAPPSPRGFPFPGVSLSRDDVGTTTVGYC